mgnify:CR=1 FL=1
MRGAGSEGLSNPDRELGVDRPRPLGGPACRSGMEAVIRLREREDLDTLATVNGVKVGSRNLVDGGWVLKVGGYRQSERALRS